MESTNKFNARVHQTQSDIVNCEEASCKFLFDEFYNTSPKYILTKSSTAKQNENSGICSDSVPSTPTTLAKRHIRRNDNNTPTHQTTLNFKYLLKIDDNKENSTTADCVDGSENQVRSMDLSMINVCNSPDKSNEMSFYDNSPINSPQPCSISPCRSNLLSNENSPSNFIISSSNEIKRRALIEVDYNSVTTDNSSGVRKCFKFAEPSGAAPKRIDMNSPKSVTPSKVARITPPRKSGSYFRPFSSTGDSLDSIDDDDCVELLDMDSTDDIKEPSPTNIDSVIYKDFTMKYRRGFSLDESESTSQRSSFLKHGEVEEPKPMDESSFTLAIRRRTNTPICSPNNSKRWKSEIEDKENKETPVANDKPKPVLQKSVSMITTSSINIMNALAKDDIGLIGDFSKAYCLPLITGNHIDLKSISAHTMAKLLKGEYDKTVHSFRVIDCRYPYEYEGGHIKGAENLYTHEHIMRILMSTKTEAATTPSEPKRHIVIFHCEFSSERGPKLSRFLRSKDRETNSDSYPALHYPELYLLHGGYKEFFKSYSELCDPVKYTPMLEPSHDSAYRHFRAQTKSWNGDKAAVPSRTGRSRSRLLL